MESRSGGSSPFPKPSPPSKGQPLFSHRWCKSPLEPSFGARIVERELEYGQKYGDPQHLDNSPSRNSKTERWCGACTTGEGKSALRIETAIALRPAKLYLCSMASSPNRFKESVPSSVNLTHRLHKSTHPSTTPDRAQTAFA